MPVGKAEALLRVNGTPVARGMHQAVGMRERRAKCRSGGGKQGNCEGSAERTDHCESPSRCSGKRDIQCACRFPKRWTAVRQKSNEMIRSFRSPATIECARTLPRADNAPA